MGNVHVCKNCCGVSQACQKGGRGQELDIDQQCRRFQGKPRFVDVPGTSSNVSSADLFGFSASSGRLLIGRPLT